MIYTHRLMAVGLVRVSEHTQRMLVLLYTQIQIELFD